MVASEWTTKEQKEWLMAHLPDYQKCDTKASYSRFWPCIYEEWEEKWPLRKEIWPDLPENDVLNAAQLELFGKALKKRHKVNVSHTLSVPWLLTARQQLRTWMSWHSVRSTARKGRNAQAPTKAIRLLKDLMHTGRRALTEAETYSKYYYKSHVRPTVDAIVLERGSTTRGERLTIIRDAARQCWEKETDKAVIADVKSKIEAAALKSSTKKTATTPNGDNEPEDDEEGEKDDSTEDMLE